MATNTLQEKRNHQEDDEEEDEALSLSDLPVTTINLNDQQPQNQEQHSRAHQSPQEDFDFRSFFKEPDMCAADEVFFKGQILPLRLSFSSEAGLLTTTASQSQPYGKPFINESRTDSLDSDFQSNNSSRSSSIRSQNSSSSTSSTLTTTPTTTKPPFVKPRIRNQFHTHPSPKPQLRTSSSKQLARKSSSSAWEFFRLGVVPTPEIIVSTKNTNSINVNKKSVSSISSSRNSNQKRVKASNKGNREKRSNHVLKQLVGKGGGLLSGCDCSFETVQSDKVMIKSRDKKESTTHAVKEKASELKKQKQWQKQGKKVMSRRRTFEWLKELHASHDDDDENKALLSKA